MLMLMLLQYLVIKKNDKVTMATHRYVNFDLNNMSRIEVSSLFGESVLDEVAKMGDDFDIEDAGLQSVIENLQSLRIGSVEDDEDDQIHLYVSSGRK